jgi:hypothetical protein
MALVIFLPAIHWLDGWTIVVHLQRKRLLIALFLPASLGTLAYCHGRQFRVLDTFAVNPFLDGQYQAARHEVAQEDRPQLTILQSC